jgi:pectate lyase
VTVVENKPMSPWDDEVRDCAFLRKDNLTIEGAAPGAVLTDTTCAGKALLVVDGNNITVRNLTLQRAVIARSVATKQSPA